MTTYSSVSMDFGGLKKNSPMIFQNDERSPMDFKGRNVCSSPNDAPAVRVETQYLCGFEGFLKPQGTPFSAPFSEVDIKNYKLN